MQPFGGHPFRKSRQCRRVGTLARDEYGLEGFREILPALRAGEIDVCGRFVTSTVCTLVAAARPAEVLSCRQIDIP